MGGRFMAPPAEFTHNASHNDHPSHRLRGKNLRGAVVPTAEKILKFIIPLVYARRWLTFGLLMLATAVLLVMALGLKPDAGYEKQIPLDHPFMQVFKKYEKAFGGANLISIALIEKDGQDIYNEHFLDKLKKVTDEVFFLPGVDRSRVQSLFTPGVRYVEIVEDGFAGGDGGEATS